MAASTDRKSALIDSPISLMGTTGEIDGLVMVDEAITIGDMRGYDLVAAR